MTSTVERHWPALLVASACVGIVLSVWVTVAAAAACLALLCSVVAVLMLGGPARRAALAVAVALVGLGWGSLRMEALGASVLGAEGQRKLVDLGVQRVIVELAGAEA